MIPEPSKRPFGRPLPADALVHLTHPLPGHKWHLPFRDAAGNIIAFNGGLAVRIRSYLPDDLEVAPIPWEEASKDLLIRFPDPSLPTEPARWKPIDDDSAPLWKFGPKPVWFPGEDAQPPQVNKTAAVIVGAACQVPVPLLQLAARLPAARVYIAAARDESLSILWKDGEATIKHVTGLPEARFRILRPRIDPLDQSYVYR